jgi:hypothetical protein
VYAKGHSKKKTNDRTFLFLYGWYLVTSWLLVVWDVFWLVAGVGGAGRAWAAARRRVAALELPRGGPVGRLFQKYSLEGVVLMRLSFVLLFQQLGPEPLQGTITAPVA